MSDSGIQIAVAIPTFRRPDRLAQLLAVLPARFSELEGEVVASVIIADNDPAASARAVAAASPVETTYVIEEVPGIAAVRNRLLAAAAHVDLIAFIDDDEIPLEGWLNALVRTWREHDRPAAVMGRVISVFETSVDPWLDHTGVFRRRERPTGSEWGVAAAGNLLLDVDQIRALGTRFDQTLGLAAGEDTLFSKQLVAAGGRIVWCNESRAEDQVPAERLTREWAMRRAYNGGNSAVRVELRMSGSALAATAVRARRAVGGVARAIAGYARHLAGRITGNVRHDARGLRTTYRGLGMITGALGREHQEYSRA